MLLAKSNQIPRVVASVGGANWCLNGGSRGSSLEKKTRARSLRRATDVMHQRSCMLSLTVILRYATPPLQPWTGKIVDMAASDLLRRIQYPGIRRWFSGLLSSGCQLDKQGPAGRQSGRSMMTGLEDPVGLRTMRSSQAVPSVSFLGRGITARPPAHQREG